MKARTDAYDGKKMRRNSTKTSLASRIGSVHDLIKQGISHDSESRTNDVTKGFSVLFAALKRQNLGQELIREHGGTTQTAKRRITMRIRQLRTILPYCTNREQETVYAILTLLRDARKLIH